MIGVMMIEYTECIIISFDIAEWSNLRFLNLHEFVDNANPEDITNPFGIDLINWWKGYNGKLCRKLSQSFVLSLFFFFTPAYCLFVFYAFSVFSSFGLTYEV